MYKTAAPYLPDWRRVMLCMEKVLNVVNPPQIPTVAIRSHGDWLHELTRSPMQKEPMMFVRKVPMFVDQSRAVKANVMP